MEKKPKGYWTYDRCLEESKKYKTVNEFRNYSASAYVISKRNNWLFDFTHLEREHHPNGYWTKERCMDVAKECQSFSEFLQKYGGAAHASINNGWIKDITWFLTKSEALCKAWAEGKIKRMLTHEECLNESKKYTSRKEFKENSAAHYYKSKKEHWIKDYFWLKPGIDIYGTPDCVYKYYFKDFNAIYIGRTVNRKNRDKQHIFNLGKDTVADFAFEHNISVPPMEIIKEHLTINEGRALEGYYIDYYQKQGFTILNKAKAGSIGRIGIGKWTYETCKAEAQKYECRSDFARKSPSAYQKSWRYKWLDTFFNP